MAEAQSTTDAASERIRETAKWLTVSLAALGGVLIAGSQLSDIGALELWSSRFYAAVIGAAVAGIGSGVILVATINTAASPAVSLKELATNTPKGAKEAVQDETLLDGHTSVQLLEEEYVAALALREQTYTAHLSNLADEGNRTAFVAANARAVALNAVARNLVTVAAYRELARRWLVARIAIVAGGAIAALGVGVFAWAANPPEKVIASAAEPAVLATPNQVTATLTSAGREALGAKLGQECPLSKPMTALNLGDTPAGPDVVVVQTGCERIRFVLVPTWGSAG